MSPVMYNSHMQIVQSPGYVTIIIEMVHDARIIKISDERSAASPALNKWMGDSIGRWEGDTLVIDTIAYEPNASGNGANVPSSANKHTVERLTLTADRLRLRYEITVEDAEFLATPGTLTQQWDHRPDLEFSPASEACSDEAAARYKPHVPQ